MARSRMSKFDASEAITSELIRIIDRGVLPWRKPWLVGESTRPLRHTGEPYHGVNNFLLTMRTMLAGYASPYWMTFAQAKSLGACVRKGEKSSVVVYYGQSHKKDEETDDGEKNNDDAPRVVRFQKSYRVFNAGQIDGLPETFHPKPREIEDRPKSKPIPHMQAFFEAIGAEVTFTGREAYYMPAVDKIYMPEIALFENPLHFYGIWAHEFGHWTKPRHRLGRDYGDARFGNTGYAREEIVA